MENFYPTKMKIHKLKPGYDLIGSNTSICGVHQERYNLNGKVPRDHFFQKLWKKVSCKNCLKRK